jgi:hypothetical protein
MKRKISLTKTQKITIKKIRTKLKKIKYHKLRLKIKLKTYQNFTKRLKTKIRNQKDRSGNPYTLEDNFEEKKGKRKESIVNNK